MLANLTQIVNGFQCHFSVKCNKSQHIACIGIWRSSTSRQLKQL